VAKVAGRLESSNLMPDYDLLATRDDRFVISEELLEKALRLKGAKPLAYTKAAYALKALHLALCLTVLMEAFRWLMALFSTTQFGLGGRMSWILAGGIRLRRGPGTNFTGYEVVTDFSSCTLKDLRELVSNGHGALLRDAKSRRHWMESALMTLKQAPPAPLPVAQEQLDLALSSPCSAAVEARLDKKI